MVNGKMLNQDHLQREKAFPKEASPAWHRDENSQKPWEPGLDTSLANGNIRHIRVSSLAPDVDLNKCPTLSPFEQAVFRAVSNYHGEKSECALPFSLIVN